MGASVRCLFICMIVVISFIGSAIVIPKQADAATGTITVAPGETKYISFGTANVGTLLLWSLSISYLGWSLTYWLETPNGTHLPVYYDVYGIGVIYSGIWRMGFNIPSSGIWSATIDYEVHKTHPLIVIFSPTNGESLNTTTFLISGTVDSWADEVSITTDGTNYEIANLVSQNWNKQMTLTEGQYTIHAKETIRWGTLSATYYDKIDLIIDLTAPSIIITTPADGSYSSQKNITLWWNGSDELPGVINYEVCLDNGTWNNLGTHPQGDIGFRFSDLQSDVHVLKVRATDKAGNWKIAMIMLICDYDKPVITSTNLLDQAMIRTNYLRLNWQAYDSISGIDHYEIQIDSKDWVNIGISTSFESNLADGWHTIQIKAVDKAGNRIITILHINTTSNALSVEGPYYGIPLFVLIALAIALVIIVGLLLLRRMRKKRNGAKDNEPEAKQIQKLKPKDPE